MRLGEISTCITIKQNILASKWLKIIPFFSSASLNKPTSCYVMLCVKCTFVHQPNDEWGPNHGKIWPKEQKSFQPHFSSSLWQTSEQNDKIPPDRESRLKIKRRCKKRKPHVKVYTSYRFQMLNVDDVSNHSTVNQHLNTQGKHQYVFIFSRDKCGRSFNFKKTCITLILWITGSYRRTWHTVSMTLLWTQVSTISEQSSSVTSENTIVRITNKCVRGAKSP